MQTPTGNKLNVRDLPNYTIGDAAKYLHLHPSTVHSWTYGQYYPVKGGKHFFSPIIEPADPTRKLLSFTNLTELHVLSSARREYSIKLVTIRQAVENLKKLTGTNRPLADIQLHTDREDLFVEMFDQFVSASRRQVSVKDVVEGYLERIERDTHGSPLKLYPIYRNLTEEIEQPKLIVIDPSIAFGRPVVADTRIRTSILADRWIAGETIVSIADDYDLDPITVEAVIRCETQAA